jgi:undecaprenyl diphosphate synthase
MSTKPDKPPTRPFPRHIAIIMDGNGRWAEARGLPRLEGHRRGVETVRDIVREASDMELEFLTLYSFSTENWRRPKAEVVGLMQLFRVFFKRHLKEMHDNNVRIRIIGRRDRLEDDILDLIDKAVETTRENTGLGLTLAFNYGARAEMSDAAVSILNDVATGSLSVDEIDEDLLSSRLYTADIPDPEIVLRTSGEQRISNYLLWQSTGAEFHFTETLWPEFSRADLEVLIDEYCSQAATQP